MNRYLRALVVIPTGAVKMGLTKLCHMRTFSGGLLSQVSPFTEITVEHGAELRIGRGFKMRDGAKLRVRRGAVCKIGANSSVNSNNLIVCRESITIGDNVQLSPNVQIYDHDHDYRHEGGVKAMAFCTSPVEIGSNVWIGANSVILRGTRIGDNCVVAAGSVVKGDFPVGSLIYQKRDTEVLSREVK